jgi:hypothetical protein
MTVLEFVFITNSQQENIMKSMYSNEQNSSGMVVLG